MWIRMRGAFPHQEFVSIRGKKSQTKKTTLMLSFMRVDTETRKNDTMQGKDKKESHKLAV